MTTLNDIEKLSDLFPFEISDVTLFYKKYQSLTVSNE